MVGEIEPAAGPPARRFSFLKAGVDEFAKVTDGDFDWDASATTVQSALSEALNARNVAFLLGAGCSSMMKDGAQVGISTMASLAQDFTDNIGKPPTDIYATEKEARALQNLLNLKLTEDKYAKNLEALMEVLYSFRFALDASNSNDRHAAHLVAVRAVIGKVLKFLWGKCTSGAFSRGDRTVLELYEAFYRRLVFRDRSLPRPWVFTTNYDLFNETAMDHLGLPYINGFSGVVERRFNPATFRYALAEQLDLTNRRWTAVDGFVYLAKLHGSISWIEDDHGLFPIRETPPGIEPGKVMIYPTPAKQNASLASPYADLFREFQSRIVREQSVLFTVGYGFGDQHLNNIIYQALTIPTFRLVIFAAPDTAGDVGKLRALNDPRIWIIGGRGAQPGRSAHYFDVFVERFMPKRPSDRIDDAVRRVVETMVAGPTGE
jgi:hypothetical protein